MKPYKAIIAVLKGNSTEEKEVLYWSDYPANTSRNVEDAGRAYIKKFGYPKRLSVLSSKKITYKELSETKVNE